MRKPQLPKSRKFYALLGGNVLVLIVLGVLVLRPIFGMLVKHTDEITQVRAETAALQQKTVELRKLKEVYPEIERTYSPLIQNVPKTRDVAGYQTELEELARLTSIQLTTVDTSSTTATGGTAPKTGATTLQVGGFPAIPVKVTVSGSYASILDFINRLETMNRFTRVTAMDLASADASGAVKATLELQTLYLTGGPS